MSAPVRAVLFDYGLVLSGPPDPAAWARMLALTGLDENRFHEAYWAFRHDYDRGALTGSAYWEHIGRHTGIELSEPQVTRLLAEDTALWTQPNQPMIDWAARLQAAGTRTGILSNMGDRMMEGVLAAMPWLATFDFLLWSHSVGLAKPDPAIYRQAEKGMQRKAESILFVDDREDNIAAALDGGMQAIGYADHADFVRQMTARGLGELWQTGQAAAANE